MKPPISGEYSILSFKSRLIGKTEMKKELKQPGGFKIRQAKQSPSTSASEENAAQKEELTTGQRPCSAVRYIRQSLHRGTQTAPLKKFSCRTLVL